ncbi:Tripartite-type tricarboxylate transporter, receptor component TctC [Variovorax sp. PDC80]|jgi:tripartite-type tricarboxylate transporter receptor subunit TctC|uniref:tripartite tricarboxylate transporter substrate binding protein n=1 Tax=Variovorax sp. PDC80 TaxID=1882827 RepID=UPI0008E0F30D|nr:tripartite tricarboxylate transporter substrate binding protein [Variovorax sp. PDC80]SFO63710.1 Tripartite-type tricarboxylate transporter, receptor component TctC [Variovorax sp. PDC80]
MSLGRRTLLQGTAALAALPMLARAQAAWPARPVRIVVPFPPGGTTDFVARLVGTELAKALGQPVVIENKPGAGTVIGVDTVAKAAPDGYSFVCVANSFAANQTLVRKLPYDTLKDLRPVALMGMSEHVLATHPGSGLKTLADLRDQAKARPGTLSFASFGNGTSAHLSGEMLKLQMGLDIVHVPYKGQGPALTDLLGGQVTMMFGNWPEFRGHVEGGKLVALGMATAQRSQYAPNIPTLAEQGVAIESNSWNGLLAPAGTPDAVVQRVNAEVNRALAGPVVTEAFRKGGIASLSGSPERFAVFVQSEIAKYGDVIRKANIQIEG